jgi:hypothetical protein
MVADRGWRSAAMASGCLVVAAAAVTAGSCGNVRHASLAELSNDYWATQLPQPSLGNAAGERLFRTAVFENHATEGVPYWILETLPELVPDQFPEGLRGFGFVWAPAESLPLGFVKSTRDGVDFVTHNCALCHAGAYRVAADASEVVVLGAPNVTFRRQQWVEALERAFLDPRFHAEAVRRVLQSRDVLSPSGLAAVLAWVPRLKDRAARYRRNVGSNHAAHPRQAPGAAAGFGAAKEYNGVFDASILVADFPSTFEQGKRTIGHWDGLSSSTLERVIGSALAIGADPVRLDLAQMVELDEYTRRLMPPRFPGSIDDERAAEGRSIFAERCGDCHSANGRRVNRVIPQAEIGTDGHRQRSIDAGFIRRITLGTLLLPFPFQNWRETAGYRADFLEGIWLRGPFLHNGSVPTVLDLLTPPAQRPTVFCRGTNVLDTVGIGFVSDCAAPGNTFELDTRLPGYSNAGHDYGTSMTGSEKLALIEFLKTL